MKLKKIVLSVLITSIILTINSKSFAKYVIEYTQIAVEIRINN